MDFKQRNFCGAVRSSFYTAGMMNPRQRGLVWAVVGVVGIWLLAWAAHSYFDHLKVTAEKVRAYVESVDLSKLSGEARAKALAELADLLNRLSFEERQRLRVERTAYRWFEQMTEAEKGQFIEATMPTGFKQMIAAFEELPEEKRKRTVDGALRRLREQRTASGQGGAGGTNAPPISPALEAQVRTIGLKSFYSESSAQTKAELAPLLEELQRSMESGRPFHGR
jgi:hypothetical protein